MPTNKDENGILTLTPAKDAPFYNLISNSTTTGSTSVTYIPWGGYTAGYHCACGQWVTGDHICWGKPSTPGGWAQIWQTPIMEEDDMVENLKRAVLALLDMLVASGSVTHEQHVKLLKVLMGEDECD